jgi:hypothetical protein
MQLEILRVQYSDRMMTSRVATQQQLLLPSQIPTPIQL